MKDRFYLVKKTTHDIDLEHQILQAKIFDEYKKPVSAD
jgi:hypothetical protein